MSDETSFPCPCCGYLTMSECPGSYDICPICFWEDDEVQLRFPTMGGGANSPSLVEAQASFRAFGSCERRTLAHCRPPSSTDARDPTWRPIDPAIDRFESPQQHTADVVAATYPDDSTALYYWRDTFWRRLR